MSSISMGRRCDYCCWYIAYVAGFFFGGYGVPAAQAKLGDTLPQLIKRFGKEFTEEGTEKYGNLKYKFRSSTYSVDAMMSRRGDKLVSNIEVYYSDKPLQANGEPPTSIVRGIMSVTAPGARWRDIPPTGTQRAAFITSDGIYMVAILPPDKSIDAGATFTVAIGKIRDVNSLIVAGPPSPNPAGVTGGQSVASSTTVENQSVKGNSPLSQADDPLAVTLPTGKIVHFKTPEEKVDYEAAMSTASVPTTPVAADLGPQPLLVVGHLTRNGVELLRLSDGNMAVRAELELRVYEKNEIAADQSFKGQRQPIFGVISEFGVDLLGYPFLVLDRSEHGFIGVQCTFDKADAVSLATLEKGQIVAVTGKHNGKLFNVQLSECALIPWKKFDYNAPEVRSATATQHQPPQ